MILDLLTCSQIKIGLESTEREECFAELLEPLVARFPQLKRGQAMDALIKREELKSTAIFPAVAVPHAVVHEHLDVPAIALGISRDGIEFEAENPGEKNPVVKLIFEIFFDEGDAHKHLQVLRDILQLLKHEDFLNEVLKASTPQQVLDIIRFFEE